MIDTRRTTMKTVLAAVVAPTALLAGGLGSAGHANAGRDVEASGGASHEVVRLADARLKFEINSTDRDGGVQVFLDAEQWKRMSIYDPKGHRIFTSVTKGIMAEQGGTELFLESAEPSFKELPLPELLDRWPAGRYEFRGRGLEGERYVGSARLTHHLPKGPKLLSPIEGSRPQDPRSTVLRWRKVPPPKDSRIIAYQVIVSTDTGIKALPTITLDIMLPPRANHLRVPSGFLKRDREYEWEVLAIEASGNQTISSAEFTTAD
jgi:hypothetical protein